jgi:AmmeMemoRadiSam system protein B
MSTRKTSVAGQFYPNTKKDIESYINNFHNSLIEHKFNLNCDFTPKAIISPHAGYIFSGFTANMAFKIVSKKIYPKRIIVIGPSHKFGFNGASISMHDDYETPLGSLDIDKEYAKYLYEKYNFLYFYEKVHTEHSTETQMPFIKYYFPKSKIIELIYSDIDYQNISLIIEDILKDKDNFIVISTDLSHFYNIDKANILDKVCLDAISTLDIKKFDQGCEACGLIGVKALIDFLQNLR